MQKHNKNAPGPLWPRMYHSDCAQPAQCPCQAKDWTRPDWNMLEVWLGVVRACFLLEMVLDNVFEIQQLNETAPGPLWPRMYHSDCAQPAQCPCQAKDWPRPDWNMLEVWLGVVWA